MTSVVEQRLKMRDDVVTAGGDADALITANAPRRARTISSSCRRWWNDAARKPHRFHAGARRATRSRAKKISSRELTGAFVKAVEAGRALNAFVTETPEKALAMADASDARIAKGEARALEGLPLAIKDLFCTKGVRTTAGSNILSQFRAAL